MSSDARSALPPKTPVRLLGQVVGTVPALGLGLALGGASGAALGILWSHGDVGDQMVAMTAGTIAGVALGGGLALEIRQWARRALSRRLLLAQLGVGLTVAALGDGLGLLLLLAAGLGPTAPTTQEVVPGYATLAVSTLVGLGALLRTLRRWPATA